MSNQARNAVALLTLLAPLWAPAQSPELLEAIRVHRPTALGQARSELEACLAAAPACDRARTLSLVVGYLALSEGDARGAAAQLRTLPAPRGLEAFHGWYLGEALSWSGERAEALKALRKARPLAPGWLKERIEGREAELVLVLGPPRQALQLLEAAVRNQPGPELLYQRGLARAAVGNARGALADFLSVFVRFPTHPHAFWAEQRLGKVSLSFEDRVARAERFLVAGDPVRALGDLEGESAPRGKSKRAWDARAALVRAQAWYQRADEAKAVEQLDIAMGGPPSVAAEAMMMRARKMMRAGENRFAREMFEAIDARYPDEAAADEAAYLSGWISIQAGDFEAAVTSFEHFEERHKDSRKRDEARWFKAWALFRDDKPARAREVLLSLQQDFPRSQLVPQAQYWAARALAQDKKESAKADAIAEFQALVTGWPGSFYAVLARERLFELGVVPPPLFEGPPQVLEVETPRELALATELSKAGLLRDAWEEVQRVVGTVRTAELALQYGHALQALGDYAAAHQLAARLLWGQVYGAARRPEAVALMYPRAFKESVERYAKDRGLDPFFAWAIMRRESTFRPEVVSSADARGLMQIIPPTAKAIAAELKIEAPDPDALYSPADNIMLGTWYLSALMGRFGHPAFSAAAYNAGPSAVLKWVGLRKDLPLDMWVEEISYKETRGYVKQVMADYFVYRSLYGTDADKQARLSLKLPVPKETGVSF